MPHTPATADNVISKKENLGLRGLCITLIVLHNLVHNRVPFIENEKWFDILNADYFINHIFGHPILGLISYLGWIGVPIFFFLSGYGLSKKYGSRIPNTLLFIKDHYLKLLLLAGPIILLKNIVHVTPPLNVLGELTFLNNVFGDYEIHPGAFWYLRVAFQFYIVYALLLRRIPVKWLLIFSFVVMCSFLLFDNNTVKLMKYHSVGWMLDFSLGVFVAQHGQWLKRIENIFCSIALLALVLFSSVNGYAWYFSSTFAVLFFLSIKRHLTNRVMIFLGSITAFLYVTHTLIMELWLFLKLDYMNGNVLYIFLSVCGYFLVCVLAAYLYGKFYKKVLALMRGAFSQK